MGCYSPEFWQCVCSPSWKMSVCRHHRSIFREHIEYPHRCRQEGASKSEPSADNNAALITNACSDSSSSVRSLEGGVDNNKWRCCSALSEVLRTQLKVKIVLISDPYQQRVFSSVMTSAPKLCEKSNITYFMLVLAAVSSPFLHFIVLPP